MVKIKNGVKIIGLKPEALLAILIANGVYEKHGSDCVLTSVTDSVHGKGSFHYLGLAFDLRTRDFNKADLTTIQQNLKEALGDEFDVVLESDHFHIEWNPK